MKRGRMKRGRLVALGWGVVLWLSATGVVADNASYQEGYRQGYEDGFQAGRKAGNRPDSRPDAIQPFREPSVNSNSTRNSRIRLYSATYGTYKKRCDATAYTAPRINGRSSASFAVSNQMCGDPDPGQRKSLQIHYACGDTEKESTAYEHRDIYVSCP